VSALKCILDELSASLDIEERPFKNKARRIGISEKRLLGIVTGLVRAGAIRRFGAFLNHTRLGFRANALVAWKVAPSKTDAAASILASFDEVSHCYLRDKAEGWPYSLYTMVHSSDRRSCKALIEKMAKESGLSDFKIMFTVRELKKSRLFLRKAISPPLRFLPSL